MLRIISNENDKQWARIIKNGNTAGEICFTKAYLHSGFTALELRQIADRMDELAARSREGEANERA